MVLGGPGGDGSGRQWSQGSRASDSGAVGNTGQRAAGSGQRAAQTARLSRAPQLRQAAAREQQRRVLTPQHNTNHRHGHRNGSYSRKQDRGWRAADVSVECPRRGDHIAIVVRPNFGLSPEHGRKIRRR